MSFLPLSKKEMEARGWNEADIVIDCKDLDVSNIASLASKNIIKYFS